MQDGRYRVCVCHRDPLGVRDESDSVMFGQSSELGHGLFVE
jgi:hypothetical protein